MTTAKLKSDYLSDDDHSVTTGGAFIRRFIAEMCSVHFCFSLVFGESSALKSKAELVFNEDHEELFSMKIVKLCSSLR